MSKSLYNSFLSFANKYKLYVRLFTGVMIALPLVVLLAVGVAFIGQRQEIRKQAVPYQCQMCNGSCIQKNYLCSDIDPSGDWPDMTCKVCKYSSEAGGCAIIDDPTCNITPIPTHTSPTHTPTPEATATPDPTPTPAFNPDCCSNDPPECSNWATCFMTQEGQCGNNGEWMCTNNCDTRPAISCLNGQQEICYCTQNGCDKKCVDEGPIDEVCDLTADFNNTGTVDDADYQILVSTFFGFRNDIDLVDISGPDGSPNGLADLWDYSELVKQWGQTCPAPTHTLLPPPP